MLMKPTERQRGKETEAVSPVIGVILMVAITVILAAVIGTFVLGLGENVDGTTTAGVSIDEVPGQAVTITIVDTGTFERAGIGGPDGATSGFGSTEDLFAAGAQVRIAEDANFDRNPDVVNSSTVDLSKDIALVEVEGTSQTIEDGKIQNPAEECYVSHSANIVSGVFVDQAGIGCSGLVLQAYGAAAASEAGTFLEAETAYDLEHDSDLHFANGDVTNANSVSNPNSAPFPAVVEASDASSVRTGSEIVYEAGAEYQIIGEVDGNDNVIRSFETEEE
jgi:flagellin-like protein